MAKRDHAEDRPTRFREGYSGGAIPEGAKLTPPQEPAAWIPQEDIAKTSGSGAEPAEKPQK